MRSVDPKLSRQNEAARRGRVLFAPPKKALLTLLRASKHPKPCQDAPVGLLGTPVGTPGRRARPLTHHAKTRRGQARRATIGGCRRLGVDARRQRLITNDTSIYDTRHLEVLLNNYCATIWPLAIEA